MTSTLTRVAQMAFAASRSALMARAMGPSCPLPRRIAMAIHIVWDAVRNRATSARVSSPVTRRGSYLTYFGLTALNPWPAIYFVALMLSRQVGATTTPIETVAYVSAIVIASASWQLLSRGRRRHPRPNADRGRLITAVVSGILITTLAARTVLPD